MNEEIKKIVELEIDLDNIPLMDMGVEVVSLVTEPAIEVDFLSFQSEVHDCEFSDEELDPIQKTILEWAEESGELISEDTIFISDTEFDFNSATAVQRAVQGLGILGKLGIRKDEPAEIKYRYSGPSAQRGFCRGMLRLNKVYSQNDMIFLKGKLGTLNPGMGPNGSDTYNVFAYKGGVNCKHHWSQVAIFRTDYGTVMIDKGPAQGPAGKSNNSNNPSSQGSVSNNARYGFSVMDAEKRMVAGPLMIPNQMILRRNEEGDPYYVYFSKDTVRRIQERFNREYKINNTDTQHDGNVKTDNVLLEQWIIESNIHDKSKFYGFERLPLGTWFGVYKINNDSDWERVKNGELRGFSIAGNFLEKAKTVNDDEQTLEQIINILREIK